MGCMGMSLSDFERLTPREFDAACKAYGDHQNAEARGSWERMRHLAYMVIQPHVKKCPPPEKLCPLPWDKKSKPKPKGKPLDKEAAMKRFAEVARRDNDNIKTEKSCQTL